jgi:hypothetical protein
LVSANEKTALTRALKQCSVCSDAQQNKTTELYKAAVADPLCADTISVVDDLVTTSVDWGCGTPCQPILEELVDNLPDCIDTYGDAQKASSQRMVAA